MISNRTQFLLQVVSATLLLVSVSSGQLASIPSHVRTYETHSGFHDGMAGAPYLAHTEHISVNGAPWLRIRFGETQLGNASYLVVRSTKDGSEQRF
jgi:hypothetical protein